MGAADTLYAQSSRFNTSHDRTREWLSCCRDVQLGRNHRTKSGGPTDSGEGVWTGDKDDEYEDDSDDESLFGWGLGEDSSETLVIDLLPPHLSPTSAPEDGSVDRACSGSDNTWMKAALALSQSIEQVSGMIRRKSTAYSSSAETLLVCFIESYARTRSGGTSDGDDGAGGVAMTDADRSMLETTVASFAAGMAKQIESLRRTALNAGEGGRTNAKGTGDGLQRDQLWAAGPVGHRIGIASSLIQRLKSEVMDPMARIQVQRKNDTDKRRRKNRRQGSRVASDVARKPLRGFFELPPSSSAVADGRDPREEDTTRWQRQSLPPAPWEQDGRRRRHENGWTETKRAQERDEFLSVYDKEEPDARAGGEGQAEAMGISLAYPPPSVIKFLVRSKSTATFGAQEQMRGSLPSRLPPSSVSEMNPISVARNDVAPLVPFPQQPPHQHVGNSFSNIRVSNHDDQFLISREGDEEKEHAEQLKQESAQLLAAYQHSDLEGVQKVERNMVEITQLLSRFSDLITEQQEDILEIHDQALQSKDNVSQGQDQLIDAAKRGEKSKHYMATFIGVMALLLLFFNWITH